MQYLSPSEVVRRILRTQIRVLGSSCNVVADRHICAWLSYMSSSQHENGSTYFVWKDANWRPELDIYQCS